MIKTLFAEIKEYKRDAILAPILVVIEVVLEVSIPFLMSIIIDQGVQNGDLNLVITLGIVMIVVAFAALLAGVMAGRFAARASAGFAKNLRKAMFDNIQNFSFANLDQYSTAGLVTRLMTDVTNVQNSFQILLRIFIRAPLMLIATMIMIFSLNTQLALIYVGVIIFLGIVLAIIIMSAHPTFKMIFKTYDQLNAATQENINGIRVVKAYVREEHEIDKFRKVSTLIYDLFKKAENKLVFNQPAMQFSMYSTIILISWLGAKMIVSNRLTTGQLMSMFTYTSTVLISLMLISMVFVIIIMSVASVQRIREVIEDTSTLTNPKHPINEIVDGSIVFDNVSFGYSNDSSNYNLQNINLIIDSGQTIGIIGGTGSAKTTLVQLIPRLYDVNAGTVFVGGKDVRKYDLEALRNQVSMVLQKNVLFSGTIKENLRWGNPQATDEQIKKACQLAQADEFIQRFPDQYDTHIEQGGNNVSGGQKQRLCIARALLKNPKILILDDSTSAVDTKTDALIRKAFLEEIPDVTKIIISQRISSIASADQIIVMNDGKIDAIGTHEQLLQSNAIYQEVYETQNKGGNVDA